MGNMKESLKKENQMVEVCLLREIRHQALECSFLNLQASLSTATGIPTKEHSAMAVNAAKVSD